MAKEHSLGSINCNDRTSQALEPLRPTLSAAHLGKGSLWKEEHGTK
jgi:hypothetical protein